MGAFARAAGHAVRTGAVLAAVAVYSTAAGIPSGIGRETGPVTGAGQGDERVLGSVELGLDAPTFLECAGTDWTPNPFLITVPITNTGVVPCTNIQAQIMPGAGLVGGPPVAIPVINPGNTAYASFLMTAIPGNCNLNLIYQIDVTGSNIPTAVVSNSVFVPCCDAAGTGDRPAAFGLGQAYPNPFNPSTTIPFTLAETGEAEVSVHDLMGNRVALLHSGLAGRGTHEVTFEAGALPSGVYFVRLDAEGRVEARKLVLVK